MMLILYGYSEEYSNIKMMMLLLAILLTLVRGGSIQKVGEGISLEVSNKG